MVLYRVTGRKGPTGTLEPQQFAGVHQAIMTAKAMLQAGAWQVVITEQ